MVRSDLRINSERLHANFVELSKIGATPNGGVTRLALSTDDLKARAWFANCIEAAGLGVQDDDVGNLSGVMWADDLNAKRLIVGSHLDTVPNGGSYDGAIGVLAALECVQTIFENGIRLPIHLEVINYTDEEGCWQSLFGSRGMAGQLDPEFVRRSVENVPFRAALARAGINPRDIYKAKRDPETIAGYLELHVEQGARLEQAGVDIGIVEAIVGRSTYHLTFHGRAAHAGTTAIHERRDALQGASAYITQAYATLHSEFPDGMFNCGNIEVLPGKFNVIPSEAQLVVECRHSSADRLSDMEAAMVRLAHDLAVNYNLSVSVKRTEHMPAAAMSPTIMNAIAQTCDEQGYSHTNLVSFAGHDAQIISTMTEAGMIFVPSVKGISHTPQEFTVWEDVERGTNLLLHTIFKLAHNPEFSQSTLNT